MKSVSHALALSGLLLAAPLTGALAQQNNPAGNYGSNRSMTATPGTADSHAASGTNTGDVGSGSKTPMYPSNNGMATNSTKPGSTGKTVVPGNNSSMASDAGGTAAAKTGGESTGGGK